MCELNYTELQFLAILTHIREWVMSFGDRQKSTKVKSPILVIRPHFVYCGLGVFSNPLFLGKCYLIRMHPVSAESVIICGN
jgi:hypothetical protein